jgi:hypothetical protein
VGDHDPERSHGDPESPLVGDAGRAYPWFDQTVIYLGTFVFAAMAVLVVVIFVKKFRQSND